MSDKVITDSNLNIDVNLIKECISELSDLPDIKKNRWEYFNEIVQERLEKYNKAYLDKFDRKLDSLVECLIKSDSIRLTTRTMKKLCLIQDNLYKSTMSLYYVLVNDNKD